MTGIVSLRFFFSSRRRHTRYIGDWSSDVCSSDLNGLVQELLIGVDIHAPGIRRSFYLVKPACAIRVLVDDLEALFQGGIWAGELAFGEIGRASCRERVKDVGVDVSLEISVLICIR